MAIYKWHLTVTYLLGTITLTLQMTLTVIYANNLLFFAKIGAWV